ncbi:hypothetical protein BD311DRAFT_147854 [Dichomitus squalens]|uniref:Transmembrane protein n=1 Tax=Dichomitus squalens TaxID=114155 RepID=A0A4Q9MT88_9APHY|nr:hypothetical protein BD311DRAFT_147854 [Dichomitus squalens]
MTDELKGRGTGGVPYPLSGSTVSQEDPPTAVCTCCPLPLSGHPTGDRSPLGTQEDQNEYDEKTRQKAMAGLVQSWMDRLQLISVITTFFAAIEAQLIGSTTPDDPKTDSMIDQAANAALAGALVIHVFAAIISFLAAFFLIRYKLSVAKHEERKVEGATHNGVETVSSSSVWSSNPHLEQVGPFRRGQPPTHLLDHCHSLCMGLSAVGFVLAIMGVMCFAWSRMPLSASIFASACCGACIVSGVAAIFWPAGSMHRRKFD